jgi:hypothetical protein
MVCRPFQLVAPPGLFGISGTTFDAVNVLNTPRWNNPVTDINSHNFGRITAADQVGSFQREFSAGARTFTVNAAREFLRKK